MGWRFSARFIIIGLALKGLRDRWLSAIRQVRDASTSFRGMSGLSQMVARKRLSGSERPIPKPSSTLPNLYRCIQDWLRSLCGGTHGFGEWARQEVDSHVIILEMRPVQLSLNAFEERVISHSFVLFCSDVSQLSSSDLSKRTRDTSSHSLYNLVRQIIEWMEIQVMRMPARYLQRKRNMIAYMLSYHKEIIPKEWSSSSQLFEEICRVFGRPMVVLFATALSNKLPIYCSPVPDPMAWNQDTLQHPWDTCRYMYSFCSLS